MEVGSWYPFRPKNCSFSCLNQHEFLYFRTSHKGTVVGCAYTRVHSIRLIQLNTVPSSTIKEKAASNIGKSAIFKMDEDISETFFIKNHYRIILTSGQISKTFTC